MRHNRGVLQEVKSDEELVVRRLLDRTGYVAPVPAVVVVVGVAVVSW